MSIIKETYILNLDRIMDKLYIALIILGIGVVLFDKIPGLADFFKKKPKGLNLKKVKDLEPTLVKEIEKSSEFMKNAAIVKDLHDTVANPQIKNYLRTTVLPELLRDDESSNEN